MVIIHKAMTESFLKLVILPFCMICNFIPTSAVKKEILVMWPLALNFNTCPRLLSLYCFQLCLHLTIVLCSCYGVFLFIKRWGKFQD